MNPSPKQFEAMLGATLPFNLPLPDEFVVEFFKLSELLPQFFITHHEAAHMAAYLWECSKREALPRDCEIRIKGRRGVFIALGEASLASEVQIATFLTNIHPEAQAATRQRIRCSLIRVLAGFASELILFGKLRPIFFGKPSPPEDAFLSVMLREFAPPKKARKNKGSDKDKLHEALASFPFDLRELAQESLALLLLLWPIVEEIGQKVLSNIFSEDWKLLRRNSHVTWEFDAVDEFFIEVQRLEGGAA